MLFQEVDLIQKIQALLQRTIDEIDKQTKYFSFNELYSPFKKTLHQENRMSKIERILNAK